MLEQVLLELALLFALCVGVAVSFHRFRLPPIVGFLVAGVLVGPHAIGLVHHENMVRELAEVGIVVLLFAVGLEVPLHQLARLKRTILMGGGVQLLGTIVTVAVVSFAVGTPWPAAVFLGFLISLSSTAASTKMLVDHGELSAPHGRTVLGIAIAQDLAVVPMILLLPLLAAFGGGAADAAAADEPAASPWRTALNLGAFVLLIVVARLLVQPLLSLVTRTRNRELFVLFLATWCLSLAVATAHLGMSLALGAFLAGILLADSDHHSQAAAETEPFRDAFASLFFVSIGMLFDWRTIAAQPVTVAVLLVAVVGGKALLVALAAMLLGQPFWVRVRAATTLAQVGEFSFVLVQLGQRSQLLPASAEALFVVVAVVSIALTPVLYMLGHRLALRARVAGGGRATGVDGGEREEHAIVIGYGPTGRTVAAALQRLGIPFVVVEMNHATVRAEREKGVPIVLGDATRSSVLHGLGVDRAQLVVLAINDRSATQRTAQMVRQLAPQAHVLARVAFDNEVPDLLRAGAHEVVPQELEASVEILARVLRRFLVADDEIGRQVRKVREQAGYGQRAAPVPDAAAVDVVEFVPGLGFAVRKVAPGAAVAGHTLAEASLRKATGCSVVALRHDGVNVTNIGPETVLAVGDTVVLLGPGSRLVDAVALFSAPATT
ncbi:MAG: cation:proton antiporter [Planctomycetota bacterium]